MDKVAILMKLLVTGLLFLAISLPLFAQPTLERISVTERSDQKGAVVRYHLTDRIDSVKVTQPGSDLVQMMVYAQDLTTENFIPPEVKGAIDRFEFHDNDAGFGVDIFIKETTVYKAAVYPDQNGKHLLLNLEHSTPLVLEKITQNSDFLYWDDYQDQEASFDYSFEPSESFTAINNDRDFKTIIIDAGHGGHDPGAVNSRLGIREKDIVLAVSLKVGDLIKEHMPDVEVIYTRDDDTFVELENRGLTSTRAKGDLFLSIHANSAQNSQAYGAEVFFLGLARSESALEVMKRENSVVNLEDNGGPEHLSEQELLIYELANAGNIAISERIASMIEDQFRTRAQRRSRGVKQAALMALWHASTPAVLVELGFLSNTNEARYLTSDYGQTILSSAIFRAVRDFKNEYDKGMQLENRASND